MHKWLLLLALAIAGCSSDGRALAEPSPDQTTTTRPLPPTSAPEQEESESGLSLISPDFTPGAIAPVDTTCAGVNTWPELQWDQVPATATELAITLTNQTNPEEPLLLWLMAGISPNETGLLPGQPPAGAFETLNDYGNLGYGSPCVESLAEDQTGPVELQFRIHVLEQPSGLAGGSPGNDAWDMLAA
ncbi:MAG: hypothetical protein AAGK32_20075, partial [Actinomycetota bacterium]